MREDKEPHIKKSFVSFIKIIPNKFIDDEKDVNIDTFQFSMNSRATVLRKIVL